MKATLLILITLISCSCSSYIESVHAQIDKEENAMKRRGGPSNLKGYVPPQTRKYVNKGEARKKAEDLTDKDKSGSLWSGVKGDSFLFVNRNIKNEGDIVIVEVKKMLKEDISLELERAFPKKKKKKDDKKEEVPVAKSDDDKDKTHDKISTRVVEKLNKDYLKIKGQKEVLHEGVKRYMSFEAVVRMKRIQANDHVSSNDLLEPNIMFIVNR